MLLVLLGLVGLAIGTVGVVLVIRGEALWGLAERLVVGNLRYLSAFLRLLLGALFLACAPQLPWSMFFTVVGWLAVLGALLLVVLPAPVLGRLLNWAQRIVPSPAVRVVGVVIVAAGAGLAVLGFG